MDAQLTFVSEPDQGTEFQVTLTLPYQSLVPNKAAQPTQGSYDFSGLTALIVEDNAVNQMVLKGMLKKQGFEVFTAENGAKALEIIEKQRVDCILMDCQMPIMDGFEATERIRSLETHNGQVPIIAVTANAMSQDKERCLHVGMNDYLSKPVKANQLNNTLSRWLQAS